MQWEFQALPSATLVINHSLEYRHILSIKKSHKFLSYLLWIPNWEAPFTTQFTLRYTVFDTIATPQLGGELFFSYRGDSLPRAHLLERLYGLSSHPHQESPSIGFLPFILRKSQVDTAQHPLLNLSSFFSVCHTIYDRKIGTKYKVGDRDVPVINKVAGRHIPGLSLFTTIKVTQFLE